jgi:hypothetical protein
MTINELIRPILSSVIHPVIGVGGGEPVLPPDLMDDLIQMIDSQNDDGFDVVGSDVTLIKDVKGFGTAYNFSLLDDNVANAAQIRTFQNKRWFASAVNPDGSFGSGFAVYNNTDILAAFASGLFTIFTVHAQVDALNYNIMFGSTTGNLRMGVDYRAANRISYNAGSTATGEFPINVGESIAINTPLITAMRRNVTGGNNATGADAYYNGANAGKVGSGNSSGTMRLFVRGDLTGSANFRQKGYIGEHLVFGRALTDAEITTVFAYLAAKWGVTLA